MTEPFDLTILVPDSNVEFALRGIVSRTRSLRIRPLRFRMVRHAERDPGCLLEAHNILRPFCTQSRYAIVVFDHEGCGREDRPPADLEALVEDSLARNGWQDRCAAIVVHPEIEAWVWSDSPRVDAHLGWE